MAIHVLLNTKGGVGKSTLSWHVMPALFAKLGKSFKIFEIDNNNVTNVFHQSTIIKDNTQTVKTSDKNIAAEIIFQTMTSNDELIIDAGGGDDAIKVTEIVKSIGQAKINWFIPLNRNLAQLKNALNTYEQINDPQNTYFILNGYTSINDIADEFLFYFGNTDMNIEGIRDQLKIEREFSIPFSNYFEIAEMQNLTIADLAKISQELTKEEAKALFFEKFQNDKQSFLRAWNDYKNSENAAQVLEQIFVDFIPFFSDGTQAEQRRAKWHKRGTL